MVGSGHSLSDEPPYVRDNVLHLGMSLGACWGSASRTWTRVVFDELSGGRPRTNSLVRVVAKSPKPRKDSLDALVERATSSRFPEARRSLADTAIQSSRESPRVVLHDERRLRTPAHM